MLNVCNIPQRTGLIADIGVPDGPRGGNNQRPSSHITPTTVGLGPLGAVCFLRPRVADETHVLPTFGFFAGRDDFGRSHTPVTCPHGVLYSEGVASHSPGLPCFAATLGRSGLRGPYPNGVASYGKTDATPLG